MQIHNTKTDYSYTIAPNPITNVDVVKDLGIFVDESLTFSKHICHVVTRALTRANLIHKCFLSRHIPTLIRAFVVYVRLLLEYASPVWNPHLVQDIKRIESVQRRFTKRLPGMANRTYRERLAITGLESFELLRLRYDLICTYKILSNTLLPHYTAASGFPGLMDINIDGLFTFNPPTHTRGHPHRLYKARCAKTARQNFFCMQNNQGMELFADFSMFQFLGQF